jgi:hypothetical protein
MNGQKIGGGAVRLWTFRCYVHERGKNVVMDWLNGLSKKAMVNLKRTLEHLAQKPLTAWERPHSSPIGNHIYVIRFKDENSTQWRIYGEHDPSRGCFVLTNFGTERGGVYDPPSAQCSSLASSRMADCRQHWDERTCSCLSATASSPSSTNCAPRRLA